MTNLDRLQSSHANGDGFHDLATYHAALEALVRKERSQRYDYAALQSLTPDGARANELTAAFRAEEIGNVWETNKADVAPPTYTTNGVVDPPAPVPDLDRYAGMDFDGARKAGLFRREDLSEDQWRANEQRMKLWRIVRRMPKGALLHCHFDGSVDVRWLIARAIETEDMCMRASVPLDSEAALFKADVSFSVLPHDEVVQLQGRGASIWTGAYEKDAWVPFNDARASYPYPHPYRDADGKVPTYLFPAQSHASASQNSSNHFDAYLHSLMTLTPHLHQPAFVNSKQAWAKFIRTFLVIAGLLGYEPTLKAYIKQMLKSHARDGIAYTEVRMNFFEEYMVRANGKKDLAHADWVRLFGEAVEETRSELKRDEPEVAFWGAKIIYVTVRIVDNDRLRWYCEDCIALKRQFPDLIVGFDLVGHEDPGVPLRQYAPELIRFRQRVAEEGLPVVPFVFHAGETLSDGGPADSNLYDAILLDSKRLGHALSLSRHPHLIDIVKERDIAVECCPISNQVLGYTSSVASHPSLIALLNDNVAVTLSSDDPAIFENFGLSYDFYQLIISSEATTLASLGVIARRSVRHTLVDDETRRQWESEFDSEWQRFVAWVCSEFGGRK